ncbi:MAG: U32 family peptidase [Microcoleaceae cyanobacterium]
MMQFNTFVASISDLDHCTQAPSLKEILLEPTLLARQGRLSAEQAQALAHETYQRGLRPVLVWDALMPERLMTQVCEKLQQWDLSLFAAVRVCDPGAAWWMKTHFPEKPLQLLAEAGNHNLEALRGWCEILGDSLERLILSIELTEQKLVEYCQTLPVACEVLGAGQILLFYSPRSLLLKHLPLEDVTQQTHLSQELVSEEPENSERYLQATIASEDSGNRPFPTLETVHGTFMFLDKDQFILDQLESLNRAGLHTVRIDLRHLSQGENAADQIEHICQQALADPVQLRKNWPRPTRSPFFKANRTTSIFQRIKPKAKLALYRQQGICLAEVLSGESGKYVVFQSLKPFEVSQAKYLALTTDEVVDLPELEFQTLNFEAIQACDYDQLFVTNWIRKASTGALLLSERP